MSQLEMADEIQNLLAVFLEKGFSFRYFYEKGGDSSCVYICRFQKGKDFFDWREVSGSEEIHIVAMVNGEYRFPTLKSFSPSKYRKYAFKCIFKKPSLERRRGFIADLLKSELEKDQTQFLGIKL